MSPFPVSAGQLITAADMNALAPDGVGAWKTYTPVLTASSTNPTLGTGSIQRGYYLRTTGRVVVAQVYVRFGTSGVAAGTGQYRISLPVNVAQRFVDDTARMGAGIVRDDSAGVHRLVTPAVVGVGVVAFNFENSTVAVDNANPWTWAANDYFNFHMVYEAAG